MSNSKSGELRLAVFAVREPKFVISATLAYQAIISFRIPPMRLVCCAVLALLAGTCGAQRFRVKVIQRQNNDTGYSRYVPGHSYTTASASANCYGETSVNCSASGSSNTQTTAPHEVSYSVTGATLTLLLPDGRMAVVNCVSKYSPKGDSVNRRSCRQPVVDEIEAEFKGKHAKLYWVVSLDGKKKESETYNVLAVLPANNAPAAASSKP